MRGWRVAIQKPCADGARGNSNLRWGLRLLLLSGAQEIEGVAMTTGQDRLD